MMKQKWFFLSVYNSLVHAARFGADRELKREYTTKLYENLFASRNSAIILRWKEQAPESYRVVMEATASSSLCISRLFCHPGQPLLRQIQSLYFFIMFVQQKRNMRSPSRDHTYKLCIPCLIKELYY